MIKEHCHIGTLQQGNMYTCPGLFMESQKWPEELDSSKFGAEGSTSWLKGLTSFQKYSVTLYKNLFFS
jgi:hypothetical protein